MVPRRRREDQGLWEIRAGNGGWVLLEGPSERIAFRVEPDATGRYRVRELHLLDTGEPVTPERLRAVRVGWLEQFANLPEERAAIEKSFARRPSLDVERAVATFDEIVAPKTTGRVYEKTGSVVAAASASGVSGLRAPFQRGYPPAFYERVAEAYREAQRRGGAGHSKPIEVIAKEANVPRSTAARWVKEARRRGALGPADPGKAGERSAS